VAALVGPWRLRNQDTAGLAVLAREGAGSLQGKETQEDEMLPGLVGAVRQALEAPKLLSAGGWRALVDKQLDIVFDEVDHDSSGKLNSAELHVAILLAYARLNQKLGSAALKPPGTRAVKELFGKGELTREAFKEVFMRKLMHKVATQAVATLLTRRLIVPTGGVALNVMSQQWRADNSLVNLLPKNFDLMDPEGTVMRSVKKVIANRALSQLGRALGPLISMRVAGAIAQGTRIEDLIETSLRHLSAEGPQE